MDKSAARRRGGWPKKDVERMNAVPVVSTEAAADVLLDAIGDLYGNGDIRFGHDSDRARREAVEARAVLLAEIERLREQVNSGRTDSAARACPDCGMSTCAKDGCAVAEVRAERSTALASFEAQQAHNLRLLRLIQEEPAWALSRIELCERFESENKRLWIALARVTGYEDTEIDALLAEYDRG